MQTERSRLLTPDYLVALALAGFTLLFYRLTLTPSLSYLSPDGNELATVPYVLGLAHSPGYPLYTWLGKVFTWLPLGDVAHRINLMSAVLGALGVGGLYLIITALLHAHVASPISRRAGAVLATLLFAFSPTFWSQAVIAEVYAPNIALVALTLLVLLWWERTRYDRVFFLFALTFGLSLGTHISNLGFAPAFILFIMLSDRSVLKRPTWWLAAIAGFGLGLAQFAWLPLKATTLNDRAMLERAPATLKGIYNYTLGAFPQFKFAFSLGELPDRVVVYLYLLAKEFGWVSLFIGVIGLVSLLARRPKHYFLLVGMYLVHVWFFIQYRVFDLEVFFLPAHFLWAIFLAFGLVEALGWVETLMRQIAGVRVLKAGRWAIAGLTVMLGMLPLVKNLKVSDHSYDVAVNDFYAGVWEMIPANAALLTQGGVFGYDAFYWQMVYDTRPDVLLPALPTPNPTRADIQGRELYSTTPINGQGSSRGPGALPQNLIPMDLWQVPLLFGAQSSNDGLGRRGRLTLYHLTSKAPDLVVDNATPSIRLDVELDGLSLIGADLDAQIVESGAQVHLVLYWRMDQPRRFQVETLLNDQALEVHEIGFGLLERYRDEVEPVLGRVIVEDYWLVIPSTTSPGSHVLGVRIQGSTSTIQIGTLDVIDEEEAMDRWLRIAG